MRTVAVEAMASCSACSASVVVANGWSRSCSRWTAMLDATSPPAAAHAVGDDEEVRAA
jgi:hypothetical protein